MSLDAVPLDQLGKTDIVPVILSGFSAPHHAPAFTQPAIVPPIPEPSTTIFCLLISALTIAGSLRRRLRA
jgi:hypothetical protein